MEPQTALPVPLSLPLPTLPHTPGPSAKIVTYQLPTFHLQSGLCPILLGLSPALSTGHQHKLRPGVSVARRPSSQVRLWEARGKDNTGTGELGLQRASLDPGLHRAATVGSLTPPPGGLRDSGMQSCRVRESVLFQRPSQQASARSSPAEKVQRVGLPQGAVVRRSAGSPAQASAAPRAVHRGSTHHMLV